MKCVNCEYWENEYDYEGFGYCDKSINDDYTPKEKDVIFVRPDEWFVSIHTGKDFGCIHFIKKK